MRSRRDFWGVLAIWQALVQHAPACLACHAPQHVSVSPALLLHVLPCRHSFSEVAAGAAAQGQAVPTQQLLQQYEAATLERPQSRRLSRDVSGRQQQQQAPQVQQQQPEIPQQAPQTAPVPKHVPVESPAAVRSSATPASAVEMARPASSGSARIMSARKPPPAVAPPGSR